MVLSLVEPAFDLLDRSLLGSPRRRLRVAGMLPTTLVDRLQRAKLHRLVRYAGKHSPFYREKFREYGINPRHVYTHADLGDFYHARGFEIASG